MCHHPPVSAFHAEGGPDGREFLFHGAIYPKVRINLLFSFASLPFSSRLTFLSFPSSFLLRKLCFAGEILGEKYRVPAKRCSHGMVLLLCTAPMHTAPLQRPPAGGVSPDWRDVHLEQCELCGPQYSRSVHRNGG